MTGLRNPELGLTFDDVSLVPKFSDILPKDAETDSRLTPGISLKTPIISAAMDTVTEAEMAIAMARYGGIGTIHRNLRILDQAEEVKKVKAATSRMLSRPVVLSPQMTIGRVSELISKHGFRSFPVVENGKPVGMLTNRDTVFLDSDVSVGQAMTTDLKMIRENFDDEECIAMFKRHKVEQLLVVKENSGELAGMVMQKDFMNRSNFPLATRDSKGSLRVVAAVGAGKDSLKRAQALIDAGADALCIDSAHGHSRNVLNILEAIKSDFRSSGIEVVAGNVATYEGARALIRAGADAVKVGIGPGSICTTRVVAGVGVPQWTAIQNCRLACEEAGLTLIADGGIKYSGDIAKAIVAGAYTVMIGSLLAGTDESPGETILHQGRSYKTYRGMGSVDAMKQCPDRYNQEDNAPDKMIAEGVVGMVPCQGPVARIIEQQIGGLKAGMGYVGCRNIQELREHQGWVRITDAGRRESHVHDVYMIKDAPNYQRR